MALVNVLNMMVLDNPTEFRNPFQFEITFECLQELQDDLEWKILYVGSANDSHQDLILDEILVGPVPVGYNKFILQADSPQLNQLPPNDILGVTVVLVTCSYREREFVRIGYYVNNEYTNWDIETDGPLPTYPNLDIQRIQRHILADKPRVTKFPIPWGSGGSTTTNANEQENNNNIANNNNQQHHHGEGQQQQQQQQHHDDFNVGIMEEGKTDNNGNNAPATAAAFDTPSTTASSILDME